MNFFFPAGSVALFQLPVYICLLFFILLACFHNLWFVPSFRRSDTVDGESNYQKVKKITIEMEQSKAGVKTKEH